MEPEIARMELEMLRAIRMEIRAQAKEAAASARLHSERARRARATARRIRDQVELVRSPKPEQLADAGDGAHARDRRRPALDGLRVTAPATVEPSAGIVRPAAGGTR